MAKSARDAQLKRAERVRIRLKKVANGRPRLSVHRSNKNIYAQVIDDTAGVATASKRKSMLEVAQTIALLSTISEREKDQNVVTLSTLHASKGLEWPHVVLAGCVEGMLPFKPEEDGGPASEAYAQRLQEERRLMYVGITRAQRSLVVSWSKKRKKGRELIAAQREELSRLEADGTISHATARDIERRLDLEETALSPR